MWNHSLYETSRKELRDPCTPGEHKTSCFKPSRKIVGVFSSWALSHNQNKTPSFWLLHREANRRLKSVHPTFWPWAVRAASYLEHWQDPAQARCLGATENNNKQKSWAAFCCSRGHTVQQTQADVAQRLHPQGEREEWSMPSMFQVSGGCLRVWFCLLQLGDLMWPDII